ncbi:MAG: hypothetical protein ACRDNI_14040 [Gaiellaceae bacterium]
MDEALAFAETVRRELAFLIDHHGFRIVSESEYLVRLDSETLGAEAMFDPRGEVGLEVFRLGHEGPRERWSYTGMVGRASVPRLLQIAAEHLQAEEAVLRGDPAFFDALTRENQRLSEEWTAYYARKGPRPQTGKLP